MVMNAQNTHTCSSRREEALIVFRFLMAEFLVGQSFETSAPAILLRTCPSN
jgi:hypothetical protein